MLYGPGCDLWSILYVPEKNVYSAFVGWNILRMSARSNCWQCFMGLLYPYRISSYLFLSITERDYWGLQLQLHVCLFLLVATCFYSNIWRSINKCIRLLCLPDYSSSLSLKVTFIPVNILCSEIYFVWYQYLHSSFLLIRIIIVYLLPSFTFNLLCL